LRHLFKKVVVRVEEERESLAKAIEVQARLDRRFNVSDGVSKREGDLLNSRRPRFSNVVSADRDRVPVGQLAIAERKDVGDDSQRGSRGKNVSAACDVFLQDIVLDGSR